MSNPTIHVAAAVIIRPDGRFLLASRPADKPYPGYWEFPGGKIEAGETAYEALVRELDEELGIHVTHATPWLTRQFDYTKLRVVLSFFRVTAWQGEPHPREGQTFAWQSADDITVAPLLPANTPIIQALTLPPILGITQAGDDIAGFLPKLDHALTQGLKLIQVREKQLTGSALSEFAQAVVHRAHAAHARVIINADAALAQQIQADGVQLTAAQLAAIGSRPDLTLVGASCHNAAELDLAEQLGCDYALLSPVLPTASHPGAPTLGWEQFASLTSNRSIPIYALGGLNAADLELAQQHGAHGIALLRGAWQ
ncbi:Nudix family hydrolase [Sulfuriferula thiophila]|uniref:Nudix family hydrolase n=1 Tax=Sulfuriferula thiophila TaxID=1781211 RepID=UPI000F612C35|nr:Nudix family hydrolase [Sulfuriferula thiophila]